MAINVNIANLFWEVTMKKRRILSLFAVVLLLGVFATPWACSTPAPVTEDLQILGAYVAADSDTSATVHWTTDRPGTSWVQYGTTPHYGTPQPAVVPNYREAANLTKVHSITLTNLTPGTT